jgi:heat shock protein HslJ
MTLLRPTAGRHVIFVCGALALTMLGLSGTVRAVQPFPFDQMLMLDVAPMQPIKRVPILKVARSGEATIGLWCKTVRGRVELSDNAIRIEAGPLPDALPQYMIDGQCSDARMQADQDTLTALSQVTGWSARGDAVLLIGPRTFRFLVSTN